MFVSVVENPLELLSFVMILLAHESSDGNKKAGGEYCEKCFECVASGGC